MRRLTGAEAAAIDAALMTVPGFSLDTLMELAGLAVATAVYKTYGPAEYGRLLVVAGPGNNGGDGLVAARHLAHWGYKPVVVYPRPPSRPATAALFAGLVAQLADLSVPVLEALPPVADLLAPPAAGGFALCLDALFGFSFTPPARAPWDAIIAAMAAVAERRPGAPPGTGIPLVSVDVPSGWHVEDGDTAGTGLAPSMLISLTAPKACAAAFTGPHHWLGGRFVPPRLAATYGLVMPYTGCEQVARLT